MATLREEFRTFKHEVREQFAGLLEVINTFANATEERFQRLETGLANVEIKMVTKDDLKTELAKYVTKNELIDIFDRRFGEFRGDMNLRFGDMNTQFRKTNEKIGKLTKTLKKRRVLPAPDATRILRMQPFPQG